MSKLSFNILPAEESYDHEVRIVIDDYDFLGKDYLGIDPPEFFDQPTLLADGELQIGRCTCGEIGCDDLIITVEVSPNRILWTNDRGLKLMFDRAAYETTIANAANDHSWENKDRRVERLTRKILEKTKTVNDHRFDWTSARNKDRTITVSYSKNGDQKIFEFRWDGKTDESAIKGSKKFLEHSQIVSNH